MPYENKKKKLSIFFIKRFETKNRDFNSNLNTKNERV